MAWAPQQENMPGTASDVRSNVTATSLAALHARAAASDMRSNGGGSLRGNATRESACLKNPT
jgi:hypothetical protein